MKQRTVKGHRPTTRREVKKMIREIDDIIERDRIWEAKEESRKDNNRRELTDQEIIEQIRTEMKSIKIRRK